MIFRTAGGSLAARQSRDALRLGASGFLLKVAPPERLVDAIRVAANGDALLDPLVTRQAIAAFAHNMPDPLAADSPPALGQLTIRETEVLRMLARGKSNAEIAADLVVGDPTVKTHVARVLMKLGLRDRGAGRHLCLRAPTRSARA